MAQFNNGYAKKLTKEVWIAYANLIEKPSKNQLGPRTMARLLEQEELVAIAHAIEQTRATIVDVKVPESRKYMNEYLNSLRVKLGEDTRRYLLQWDESSRKLQIQSRTLFTELLLSEKDVLQGQVDDAARLKAQKEEEFFDEDRADIQTWSQDKNEFWFDEIGSHQFTIKSKCKASGINK